MLKNYRNIVRLFGQYTVVNILFIIYLIILVILIYHVFIRGTITNRSFKHNPLYQNDPLIQASYWCSKLYNYPHETF